MANLKQFLTADGGGIKFLWKLVVKEVLRMSNQLMTWANGRFVQSINGKAGSSITIGKDDVGLGNVENTADKDKHVAHAVTADNADTLDGKQANDFMLKTEHKDYEEVTSTALNDLEARKADRVELANLDERKVDKEDGKVLSSNDYTNEEKVKLAGIEAGAQVNDPNTVVDGSYVHTDNNYTTAEKNKLAGIEDGAQKHIAPTADEVKNALGYTPADKNNLVDYTVSVKESGASGNTLKSYVLTQNGSTIGTINIPKDLFVSSGSIVVGNWADGVFTENVSGTGKAVKLVIANQADPIYINVQDLVDVYTAQQGAAEIQIVISNTNEISATLVKSVRDKIDNAIPKVAGATGKVAQFKADGSLESSSFEINKSVPADAKFTDTIIDNEAGDGIDVSGEHNKKIALSIGTKAILADAVSDHTKLGGHTIGKDVPADAEFTDEKTTKEGHYTPAEDASSQIGANAAGGADAWDFNVVTGLTLKRDSKGHVVGVSVASKKVPANPNTDHQTDKEGHYIPADEKTLSPDASVLRDPTRDMAFVGAVHEDDKGHVVAIETVAILALTNAEIQAIVDEATAEIAAEMA